MTATLAHTHAVQLFHFFATFALVPILLTSASSDHSTHESFNHLK